ncbi:MAG: hypothetical protein ACYC9M_12670 [Desulfobulbaceae bacterium]
MRLPAEELFDWQVVPDFGRCYARMIQACRRDDCDEARMVRGEPLPSGNCHLSLSLVP